MFLHREVFMLVVKASTKDTTPLVIHYVHNYTHGEFLVILCLVTHTNTHTHTQDVADIDHSQFDCLMVAVLTHGINGKLYSTDGDLIPVDDFTGYVRLARRGLLIIGYIAVQCSYTM